MNTLYTLGYAGWTLEQVKQKVEELGAWLVDIRFSPTSRLPQWRANTLYHVLGPQQYFHLKALGNPNYKGGPIELLDPESGLLQVQSMMESRSVILMCACKNVHTCHRKVAAAFLSERLGAPIVHLEPPK